MCATIPRKRCTNSDTPSFRPLTATALDKLVREGPFDLLLTDVVMPGMNGRALAEAALKLVPNLKVLYMTGYSRNAILHHGRLDPGVALIQKPFSQSALAVRIERMLVEAA